MRLTLYLVAANVIIFIAQAVSPLVEEYLALTPVAAVSGAYWQFITYMFLHAGIFHIFINMLVLFIFGVIVERAMGGRRFLILYFVSGVGSSVLHLALTGISDIPMLGASGAVFGVLTAYAFLFPKSIVWMFPGIPLPAAFLVILFAALELFSGVFGLEPGIANFGHLGGIITAVILMLYWRHEKKKERTPGFREFEFIWE